MATTDAPPPEPAARVHVQKFGTFLSNMVHAQHRRVHRLGPDHRVLHPVGLDNLGRRQDRPRLAGPTAGSRKIGGWGDWVAGRPGSSAR